MVAVARRGTDGIYQQAAESLGAAKGAYHLYDLDDPQLVSLTLDSQWTHAENHLRELIDNLDSQSAGGQIMLSADLFMRVLVPLTAQLLVRHPEWEDRYTDRVREVFGRDVASRTEMNHARNIEYLALCGVLISREWWVVHDVHRRFVSSDLGVSQAAVNDDGSVLHGYLWPLSSQTAVFVGAGRDVGYTGGSSVPLKSRRLSDDQVRMQNEAIARWSPTVVFGREPAIVAAATEIWKHDPTRPELADLIPAALLERDFSPDDIEAFLRALHVAEAASSETGAPQAFEQCEGCAYQLAWTRSAFPDGGAAGHNR